MQITALSGGIGGARFLAGLRAVLSPDDALTVIGNTADDIWLYGLKVCPDLDSIMYTLGGGIDPERGWGRADETWHAKAELAAYGVQPNWFGLGDRDLATHLVRTQMLDAGYSLTQVTEALCTRWQPGVRLLPMSDDRIETHIVIDDDAAESGQRAMHFQEYWIRLRAGVPARSVVAVGAESAKPGRDVIEAIADADIVVLPPSNPIVSIGTILGVPGIRDAVRGARGPVVGLSPIVGGAVVRGMADRLLAAYDIAVTARGVAEHYGARSADGLLDGWLVDTGDSDAVDPLRTQGIATSAVGLLMSDPSATEQMARDTLELAASLRR